MKLVVLANEAAWIAAILAEFEAALAERAAGGRSRPLHLCLAGGRTPAPAYRAMASLALRDVAVELWLGDERAVRPSDEAWNGHLLRSSFEACVWDPLPHLRLWPELQEDGGEVEARAACALYAAELMAASGSRPRPIFDLALLGLGADGHTASLFPGDAILGEERLFAGISHAPSAPRLRMSLTYPALAGARRVRFLARGKDKLDIVRRLEAEDDLPAARIGVADTAILYCEK